MTASRLVCKWNWVEKLLQGRLSTCHCYQLSHKFLRSISSLRLSVTPSSLSPVSTPTTLALATAGCRPRRRCPETPWDVWPFWQGKLAAWLQLCQKSPSFSSVSHRQTLPHPRPPCVCALFLSRLSLTHGEHSVRKMLAERQMALRSPWWFDSAQQVRERKKSDRFSAQRSAYKACINNNQLTALYIWERVASLSRREALLPQKSRHVGVIRLLIGPQLTVRRRRFSREYDDSTLSGKCGRRHCTCAV